MYTSANRDEEVFADAQTFDIRRSPNPHLSFGIGGHFCLGVHLARMEARIFFEELLDAFATIELLGDAGARPHQPQQRLQADAGAPGAARG